MRLVVIVYLWAGFCFALTFDHTMSEAIAADPKYSKWMHGTAMLMLAFLWSLIIPMLALNGWLKHRKN